MADPVTTAIQSILSEKFINVKAESISPVGGGCINETAKIKTNEGIFFAKWNEAKRFPKMLEVEAKGLKLLKEANEIKVPEVIAQRTVGDAQYLILEYIGTSPPNPLSSLALPKRFAKARRRGGTADGDFWNDFGISLAKLHRHSSKQFGLDHDNYIGSLPQSNNRHSTWNEFFILERLEPQLKLAIDSGRISSSVSRLFSKLFSQFEKILPDEKPALVHGDLWSGNYMVGNKGEPVVIDPAVYYGHREMDIAMTKLFGGFPGDFYGSYNEEFPLEPDWEKRMDVCNLYPLLVHVNLFGGGYLSQVEGILRRF